MTTNNVVSTCICGGKLDAHSIVVVNDTSDGWVQWCECFIGHQIGCECKFDNHAPLLFYGFMIMSFIKWIWADSFCISLVHQMEQHYANTSTRTPNTFGIHKID
jgi:hypothetical protein